MEFFDFLDLAPGVDEIYQESKEIFLTPGHPQDGQVVFYKVRDFKFQIFNKNLINDMVYDQFHLPCLNCVIYLPFKGPLSPANSGQLFFVCETLAR